MIVFETERLIIRRLESKDQTDFFELLSNPEILRLIPQQPMLEIDIKERFDKSIQLSQSDILDKKCAFGVFEKGKSKLIGLSLFLLNEDNEQELGYRFQVEAWGNGFGTELTNGMLNYYFDVLKVDMVFADVNIANPGSVKILDKFMKPYKEFFNERDNCNDRCYSITKQEWCDLGL